MSEGIATLDIGNFRITITSPRVAPRPILSDHVLEGRYHMEHFSEGVGQPVQSYSRGFPK